MGARPPQRLEPGLLAPLEERTARQRRRLRARGQSVPSGRGGGRFDEQKHPRGGKGSAEGGKFVGKGSKGGDVKAVQQAIGQEATGVFDQGTVDQLRKYQAAHGLKADGVAGAQTVGHFRGKKQKVGSLTKEDRSYLKGGGKGASRARARGGGPGRGKGRKARKKYGPGGGIQASYEEGLLAQLEEG